MAANFDTPSIHNVASRIEIGPVIGLVTKEGDPFQVVHMVFDCLTFSVFGCKNLDKLMRDACIAHLRDHCGIDVEAGQEAVDIRASEAKSKVPRKPEESDHA